MCSTIATLLRSLRSRHGLQLSFYRFLPCIFAWLIATPLLVAQAPVITQQPVSTQVLLGDSATFRVQATGAVSYQWIRDYTPIPGATSSTYTFKPQAADTGHEFQVVLWSADAIIAFSQEAWLHVTPRADIPTVTDVEDFGTVAASQVADSFGMVVNADQDWQYAAVAAMGGKWIRADSCQWEIGEVQVLPANVSAGFDFANSPACMAEIQSAKRYRLHLDNVAYWAPPHGVVAEVTVSANVPAGSMFIPVTVKSGSLAGYPARDLLLFDWWDASVPFQQHIDGGAPVDSMQATAQGTTLGLTQPSTSAMVAGTALEVQALLYPPVLIAPSTDPLAYLNNESVQAWTRYVGALQNFIKDQGVTGAVELWNEPDSSWESWDNALLFYDTPPPHFQGQERSAIYLAFAATTLPAVPEVKLLNGWANLSGYSALNNPFLASSLPVSIDHLNATFAGNAVHPYGNNPEQTAWLPAVVRQDGAAGQENVFAETPIGGAVGANFKSAAFYNALPGMAGGVPVSVTETGIQADAEPGERDDQRTRFDVRQFLSFAGMGVHPVIFFKAGGDAGFEWFGSDAAHTPLPVAAAFTGMLADIRSIGGTPAAAIEHTPLPIVSSYKGFYPLATTSFVGTGAGATGNSILFYAWQKTYTVAQGAGDGHTNPAVDDIASWLSLPSPPAVPLQLTLPAGYTVRSVVDVDTQQSVGYTLAGRLLTYPVTDDPVEVLLVPLVLSTPRIDLSATMAKYGSVTAQLSASVLFTGTSAPSNGLSFQVGALAQVAASCAVVSAGAEQCTATYPVSTLPAGTYTVTASTAADALYNASVASGSLNLTPEKPLLSLDAGTASLDNPSTSLSATLSFAGNIAPTGAVSFLLGTTGSALVATCSGATSPLSCRRNYPLASLPAGLTAISVSFSGDANYAPASIASSMTIAPASATVVVQASSATYGASFTTLVASVSFAGTNAPSGPLTFAVGKDAPVPATCTGSTSPLVCTIAYPIRSLGAGDYGVTAALSSDGRFAATTAASRLTIAQATPLLALGAMSIPYGQASVTIPLNLQYPGMQAPLGAVTVTVDSNPPSTASCIFSSSSSVCTATYPATGLVAGTHTILAVLAADADYKGASATSTLTVVPSYHASSIWIANGNGTMTALTPAGAPITGTTLAGGGIGASVDGARSVWSLSPSTGALWKYSESGAVLLSGAAVSGMRKPTALAVDGAGVLWIVDANSRLSSVDASKVALAVASYDSGLSQPTSVHVDASGSLWITNAGDNSLTEVIGIATPPANP